MIFKHNNVVGIDISDYAIKVLQLDDANAVTAYGQCTLEPGIVVDGKIIQVDTFVEAMTKMLANTKPTQLLTPTAQLQSAVSLPESKLFTYTCKLPGNLTKDKTKKYVEAEALKVVPFNITDLYWSYYVVTIRDEQYATFAGAPKDIVENYVQAFTQARVQPLFIGGAFFSLGRAVLPDDFGEDNFMIVDIGASATNVGVFDQDAVANLSIRIPKGGAHFTQSLMEALSLEHADAESQKYTYGVDIAGAQTEVSGILQQSLEEVIEEIIKAKEYFQEKTKQQITQILLTGGSANMKSLDTYVVQKTGVATTVADPFIKISNKDALLEETSAMSYANVIGLALRGVHKNLPSVDLFEVYRSDPSNSQLQKISLSQVHSVGDAQYILRDRFQIVITNIKKIYQAAYTWILTLGIKKPKLLLTVSFLSAALLALAYTLFRYL